MSFKVTRKFGDGASETRTFDDELEAREEGNRLSTEYAREYGRRGTEIFQGDRLILDMRETYCD